MPKVRRLYNLFKPEKYTLCIDPNLKRLDFRGSVNIEGKLSKSSSIIWLHADGLKVSSAEASFGNTKLKAQKITLDDNTQELKLKFARTLPKKLMSIKLNFKGKVRDDMHGLYSTNFKLKGRKHTALSTQFEAKHAREVFPCVDEPEAKAIFELTLITPKHLTTIANTPIANQKQGQRNSSKLVIKFEPTPKMSTYLLAFVIGKFEAEHTKSKHGVDINVYATPDKTRNTPFALKVAADVLDYFEDYFEIPYPLPKLDLVAVPDFAAGAMENWGLVTFREELLLLDRENSSVTTEQFVAIVIAHELAHQWFGNLVTMKWWTDLWLNEGFASWIEYLAVDHLFPKWQIWTQFISNDLTTAMELDGLANTHPVEVPVNDPAEIQQIFDAISYQKGASIIRMLHKFLGSQTFRKGLVHYLKKYAYSSATTSNLWQALEEHSGQPVIEFMSAWTKQAGYPLVAVTKHGSGYRFKQEVFRTNPKRRSRSKTTWPIPLSMAQSDWQLLFKKPTGSKQLPKIKTPKFNLHQSGFYRCLYPQKELSALDTLIKNKKLAAEDRMGLLDDAFALASSGYYDTGVVLDLLDCYSNEDNAAVWQTINGNLGQFISVFNEANDDRIENSYAMRGQNLIAKKLKHLGWQIKSSDSHFDRLLRPMILNWAVIFRHMPTILQAYDQFHGHLNDTPIHPDLRRTVYSAIARTGSEHEYKKVLKLYKSSNDAEERARLLAALSRFKDPSLIEKNLNLIKSYDVRPPEVPRWINGLLIGRYSKDLTWLWFKNNWDWLLDRFGDSYHLSRFVNTIGDTFVDYDHLEEVKNFFGNIEHAGIQRNIEQAIETIELQAEWRKRDFQPVLKELTPKLK